MKNNIHVPDDYHEIFTNNEEYTRQFAIIFQNSKEVIYQNPELMDNKHGCPILKPTKYVVQYHPERLSDLQQIIEAKRQQMDSWMRLI